MLAERGYEREQALVELGDLARGMLLKVFEVDGQADDRAVAVGAGPAVYSRL